MTCKLLNISHNDPITFLATIGRTCYSNLDYNTNYTKYDKNDNIKLLKHLISSGHHSVLEHITLTFLFDNVSRVFSHQLVRHRVASYTQRSQRYCDESNSSVVIPESIKNNSEAYIKYINIIDEIHKVYNDLKTNDNINKEDVRYILPNSCNTIIIATFNLREYIHVCQERLCNRAQKEIRDNINESLNQLKENNSDLYNLIEKFTAPSCYTNNKCRETNSCGHPYTR